jgi:hypothetical protein
MPQTFMQLYSPTLHKRFVLGLTFSHVANGNIGITLVNANICQIYVKRRGPGLNLSQVANANIGVNFKQKLAMDMSKGWGQVKTLSI